ncbi:MAG TPA: hypothetical protein VFI30_03210 [Nocardioidaceae bacterium]|nr:hypothetical protein [Nocardioidaceae bacterium]
MAAPHLPASSLPRSFSAIAAAAVVGALCLPATATASPSHPAADGTAGQSTCALGPGHRIKHVIYLSFDNVHFLRDNPNVPSDLEQMPHLLDFLEHNGSFLTDNHTPLMSHTGTDLLSAATGLYGDRHGQPISNNYRYYHPDGSTSQANSFTYWTAPVYDGSASPSDTSYSLLGPDGSNTPAPWVPFTRAGCDFGSVASANAMIENVSSDVPLIFGANSPEAQQVANDPDYYKDPETAQYGGLAVHCAVGSAFCADSTRPVPDTLPDEPGGYAGHQMVVGNKYLGPEITADHSVDVRDIFGNVIMNPYAHQPGFPGFDGMTAATTLGYVADLQEAGVPVTFAYLSDVHDPHAVKNPRGGSYGPGEAGMEQQLRQYDDAFAAFFARMQRDGITPANTLYVVTADEGDHFIGTEQTGCDGVNVPCTYTNGQDIGELNTNISGLLATQRGNTTPFDLYAGAAPAFYLPGDPAPEAPAVRQLERDTLAVTATDPYTGVTGPVNRYLADQTELRLLHMVTGDPARTPTFWALGNPDFYEYDGPANCTSACVAIDSAYAWNHGTVAPDITRTWLGLAGPGVRRQGLDTTTWADQTDIRPTMLALLGLRDDYVSDGRVLVEDLTRAATPPGTKVPGMLALMHAYKQLNACVGQFGLDTLAADTRAAESGSSADDSTYDEVTAQLAALGRRRDAVAEQIRSVLDQAEFGGRPPAVAQVRSLTQQADALLAEAHTLASSS